VQLDNNTYKSFLPEFIAQEMLENHLFIEEPGYYLGEGLEKSHENVEEALVSWKEFAGSKSAFKN
jgi:hypothetical protein